MYMLDGQKKKRKRREKEEKKKDIEGWVCNSQWENMCVPVPPLVALKHIP